MTIREAALEWVKGFNAIPLSVIEKLGDFNEVTPFVVGDYVNVCFTDEFNGMGKIIDIASDASDEHDAEFVVQLEQDSAIGWVNEGYLERITDSQLPAFSTMWTFGESIDDYWLENGGLEEMAKCGFRIYEQEDCKYIFGIDGAGYDFYDEHWIPLYKARGLQWHDKKDV